MLEQQQAVHHRKTIEVHVDVHGNKVEEEILTEPVATMDEKNRHPNRKEVFAGWWQ